MFGTYFDNYYKNKYMKYLLLSITAIIINLNVIAQTPGIKITKATHRKTYSGASPVIIHSYQILLKKTIATDLKIESITAIADGTPIDFTLSFHGGKNNNKTINDYVIKAENKATLKLQFSNTLQSDTDRRGRPNENSTASIDLSEGIKLIYSFGGNQYTIELKKFEELPPVKGQ